MTLTRAEQEKTGRAEQDGPPPEEEPPWITVVAPGEPVDNEPAPPSGRRVLAMMLLGAALISILVAISGSVKMLAETTPRLSGATASPSACDMAMRPCMAATEASGSTPVTSPAAYTPRTDVRETRSTAT